MEPNDDFELRRLLREWHVPDAPDSLRPPRGLRPPSPWTSWLRRDIRIPVPVAVALAVLLVWLGTTVTRDRAAPAVPPTTTDDLRGFEPVNAVNVRIERRGDATR